MGAVGPGTPAAQPTREETDVSTPDDTGSTPAGTPDDLPDGEIGLLPGTPGPTGTGEGTDAGADPDAPEHGS